MHGIARTMILAALVAAPAAAHAQGMNPATATGLRKELIAQLDDAQSKFVALANATPQDKYGWRPPGARSMSEVFMHIVGANLMIPGMIGVPAAAGVTLARDAETTVTDKAQIVDLLGKAFVHAKMAVMHVPDAEMNTATTLFGSLQTTKRGTLVLLATHSHEHLGQAIAYARMNGIVPPWSR